MTDYATNAEWSDIADRVRSASRIALVTHAKPDGDAVGSLLAFKRAQPADDPTVTDIFLMGPIEGPLHLIINDTPYFQVETHPPGDDYDLIIIADTGTYRQLEPLVDWLKRHRERVICIDHHANGDDGVAPLRIVDPSAPAAALLMVRLIDELGWTITGGHHSVAEAAYTGLATDTGWFRYENAQAPAFALAARLLEIGVDKSRLYQLIEETYPPERLALEVRALSSLRYAADGSVAIQTLTAKDLEETGCGVELLTGVVNLPMITRQVRVSVLLTETSPGETKMSFRAKPSLDDAPFTDVNALAQQFGGGGHIHASGARVDCSIAEVVQRLVDIVESRIPAPASE
jgi:phosphoesterase RecJ-like protein